ncbi:MAG: sodium-coupled transporter [Synechococcales cyanobacterium T60_A2020_003]|nr:sodium-coupled transporter [Synechococcales cyanobacterium T60_A2020_003]
MTTLINPIALTLIVIVLALVCFVAEWLPADITAIVIAVVLMLLGLVTPEQGVSGFGNSATVTVMAMFILSAGISRTGVVLRVRDLFLQWGGKNIQQQILVMGLIVGPITAFINNTAVVAVFLPIIEEWCRKQRISPSKLLIPLSYATILGGMITLIGTSTNVLASGLAAQLGYGEFGLFQFTALGLTTFTVGMLYLIFIAPRVLPSRRPADGDLLAEGYDMREYVSEVVISPRSSLIGQTLRSTELQRKFDFDVLELIRDNVHFPQPLADKVLAAGDILLVRSTRDDLLRIRDEQGLDILPAVKFDEEVSDLASGEERMGEVLILSNSRLAGSTLKELRFRQRYNATVIAIRRGSDVLRERLGKVPLKFGDLLLVQGPKESFLGLQTTRELLVLEERDIESLRQDKAWIALAIIFSVIVLAAFNITPIMVSALAGVVLMILTGCLKPGEVYGAVRWDVIFLLAGLIPLGIAMDESGATKWLADVLVSTGGNLSGYWILLFFFAATSLLTETISNNAAVVLMLPVAVEVAKALSLNPLAFMFAVTFAASNSFMTPIGYQTNTMVYGPGGYKFLDFVRVGGPLNLLMAIVTPILIVVFYGLK